MDRYSGGDLCDALERHFHRQSRIPISAVQRITKMMVQSVAWLHQNSVVHCDVKPDNLLMDRQDIEHPSCRVYLSDFDTAQEIQPGQRLTQKLGTRAYWAPEVWDLNYGFAVDVW